MPTNYGSHLWNRFLLTLPGRAFLRGIRQIRRRRAVSYETNNSVIQLVRDIDSHGKARRVALVARVRELLTALNAAVPADTGTAASVQALVDALHPLDHQRAWLMIAVIRGKLPSTEQVRAAVRYAQVDGMVPALRVAIWSGPAPRILDGGPFRPVQVVTGAVLVDVHHTAEAAFATGIQRVTRETVRRWVPTHHPTLIGWHSDLGSLRALTPAEIRRTCWGGPAVQVADPGPVIVPMNCTYLLPELATETERTDALRCLAEYSPNRFTLIGYDMVPITVPETCAPAMPAAFARNLAAVRHASTVATISEAAAIEYGGWARMLHGIGIDGPQVVPCILPNEVSPASPAQLAAAADRLLVGGLPMVLVVGSHEPRKNHLAILHAAELLWREGQRFSLTFIGGRSWSSDAFSTTLAGLQAAGRPIETIANAADDLLWSAYRLARFTVFPSLNEGFGLPVVESITCGTPVITSDFGAMREIAADGGARMVDPRDDQALAAAMRELLTDDAELERLTAQAAQRPVRTWDVYAEEVWDLLAR